MRADECKKIIEGFEKLSYKAVLVNGGWGIGKTYAVSKALPKEYSCIISLFGINNAYDIYHDILMSLYGDKSGKIARILSDLMDGGFSVLAKYVPGVAATKEIKNKLSSLIKEKEILVQILKKLETRYIIVFDDLERMSNSIRMEEVLGIIEELKQISCVRIIVIANVESLQGDGKQVFQNFSEKVIDREYTITELASDIEWKELGILESKFVEEFIHKHSINNLRTVKKAEAFFEDVKQYSEITDNEFLKSVKTLCYIVVSGCMEKENDIFLDGKMTIPEKNRLISDGILPKYMEGLWYSMPLYEIIKKDYCNSRITPKERFKIEYEMYLKSERRALLFKSEEEVRKQILMWRENIEKIDNIVEFCRFVEENRKWMEVLGESTNEINIYYEENFEQKLWDYCKSKQQWRLLSSWDFCREMGVMLPDSKLDEILKRLRVRRVQEVIDILSLQEEDDLKMQYAVTLKQCFKDFWYEDIVKENCTKLLMDSSFPLGSISEERYEVCSLILYVLKIADETAYQSYLNNLLPRCSKMDAYRIDQINKAIEREITPGPFLGQNERKLESGKIVN